MFSLVHFERIYNKEAEPLPQLWENEAPPPQTRGQFMTCFSHGSSLKIVCYLN